VTDDSDACSLSSRLSGEPVAGTAPEAHGWLVIEHPGPWGRDALVDSPLPPAVVDWCRELHRDHGIRTLLARHPTRRQLSDRDSRNVWFAACAENSTVLRHRLVDTLVDLQEQDLSSFGAPTTDPLELICTHSKRDACCALYGRRRILARPWAWECSHLGGHRFAATSLMLPSGVLFGRLEASDRPDLTTDKMRGASYLSPVQQVADIAVRNTARLDPFAPLQQLSVVHNQTTAMVRISDGTLRAWTVACELATFERAASCAKPAEPAPTWVAVSVIEE